MPQSPYRTTVYPPIEHLDSFREILTRQRLSYDDDERDKEAEITLLDVGDDLLAHCDFLETKLNLKVCFSIFSDEANCGIGEWRC